MHGSPDHSASSWPSTAFPAKFGVPMNTRVFRCSRVKVVWVTEAVSQSVSQSVSQAVQCNANASPLFPTPAIIRANTK